MTWWAVSTQEKKNVFEHELWQKDQWVIRRITGYRWGTVLVETANDEPPVLDQTSGPGADAVDIYYTDYVYELDNLSDGWYAEVIYPDDMPESEQERLEQLWEDEYYSGWENHGWVQYDNECWFSGPLEIVPHEPVWAQEQMDQRHQDADAMLTKMQPAELADDHARPAWPFPTGNPNVNKDAQ